MASIVNYFEIASADPEAARIFYGSPRPSATAW